MKFNSIFASVLSVLILVAMGCANPSMGGTVTDPIDVVEPSYPLFTWSNNSNFMTNFETSTNVVDSLTAEDDFYTFGTTSLEEMIKEDVPGLRRGPGAVPTNELEFKFYPTDDLTTYTEFKVSLYNVTYDTSWRFCIENVNRDLVGYTIEITVIADLNKDGVKEYTYEKVIESYVDSSMTEFYDTLADDGFTADWIQSDTGKESNYPLARQYYELLDGNPSLLSYCVRKVGIKSIKFISPEGTPYTIWTNPAPAPVL